MLKLLIFTGFVGISTSLFSQVEKLISINSVPDGAFVSNISGKSEFLGYTPFNQKFNFHSDISILKLRLSSCGFYDTIIKISPQSENLTIKMERKKFIILPETEKELFSENDKKSISSFMVDFLNDFILRNSKKPINFSDFAMMKRSADKTILNVVFELDPAYLNITSKEKIDSLLQSKWDEWFNASVKKFNDGKLSDTNGIKIYFSVISGKKGFSLRQMPGVDVRDELKSQTYVSEGNNETVTTTIYYYETEVNPTFGSTLDQTQKYFELLYEIGKAPQETAFSLQQKALSSFSNGKFYSLFKTSEEINNYSMLTRYLSKK